jgi:tyrosyl-tRNA synthetase
MSQKITKILAEIGFTKSCSESRRLITLGSVFINDKPVSQSDRTIEEQDFVDGEATVRVGRKRSHTFRNKNRFFLDTV